MGWVLDLDGVVWLSDKVIPGSAEAVAGLRRRGTDVVFLTNNSANTVGEYVRKLEHMGIRADRDDVITSAQAAASLLEPGGTALVCGGAGVVEALEQQNVKPVSNGSADAVVVGWHREFDYGRLTAATTAVMAGARLVGTNDDATYPTAEGALPGAGSLLAAVAYASRSTPVVAGKPNEPVVRLLRNRLDNVDVVVGDRPSTDGALARRLGAPYALVLSGVTGPGHGPVHPEPDLEAADLSHLVAMWEAAGRAWN